MRSTIRCTSLCSHRIFTQDTIDFNVWSCMILNEFEVLIELLFGIMRGKVWPSLGPSLGPSVVRPNQGRESKKEKKKKKRAPTLNDKRETKNDGKRKRIILRSTQCNAIVRSSAFYRVKNDRKGWPVK